MVNGWKTKKLGEVAEVCMCKRIFAHQTSKIGNIPFYKIGTFGKEADAYISSQLYEEYKAKYSYPEKGDVLISAAGTLGRTVVFDGRPAYFQDSNIVWLKIDKSQLCNDYLAHYYKVIKWASSEGSTISRLYNGIICDTEILLPPLEEQAAIAEALSDVDSLISSLQKLIEKKKAIKQGTMQELLTGKKRLPGFSGKRKRKKLGNYIKFEVGFPFKSRYFNSQHIGLRLIKNRDLKSDDQVYYTTEDVSSEYIVNNGDVLVGMDGDFTPCIWRKGVALLNQRVGRIGAFGMDLLFSYYLLQQPLQELQIGTGATTVKHLSHFDVEELELTFPEEIKEQQAIAQVLSDMDNDIEQLEKKLSKYQQIKQGMMQELLTGRIRLV